MKLFLCALGLVFIMEGVPYFAFPDRVKDLLARVGEVSSGTLRILGLAAILTGLFLVYLGRN
jgi:uncharacterized protein YjeT (DUF2065 family)